MTPALLRAKVIAEKGAWIREMITRLRLLPLESPASFQSDSRNPAAAESYLRRALEALFDLGRHILAKGYGQGVSEYKEIARILGQRGILSEKEAEKGMILAGYRNRMVHFYQEVSQYELYEICTRELTDIEELLSALLGWVKAHPELVDQEL